LQCSCSELPTPLLHVKAFIKDCTYSCVPLGAGLPAQASECTVVSTAADPSCLVESWYYLLCICRSCLITVNKLVQQLLFIKAQSQKNRTLHYYVESQLQQHVQKMRVITLVPTRCMKTVQGSKDYPPLP